jgi:hypothetical protein
LWLNSFHPRTINECDAIGGLRTIMGNRTSEKTSNLSPIQPEHVLQQLNWNRTQDSGERAWWPADATVVRPYSNISFHTNTQIFSKVFISFGIFQLKAFVSWTCDVLVTQLEYLDVLCLMLSLLGNGKSNTSMDNLDSPAVTYGYMATKNGRPQE